MRRKSYYYKLVEPRSYNKTCIKCGGNFTSQSKNKRLCDKCKKENYTQNNNARVRNYYKKYGKNKNKIGTGRLNEHPLPPFKEIDAILDEMRNLNLL